jgi:hypothetical protein
VQHLRVAGQLRDHVRDPVRCRDAVELVGARQQRPAGLGLLVHQGDAGSGPRRAEGGGQPRGAGPHDQHVDVGVDGVVPGGVGDLGEAALTRQAVRRQPVGELDGRGQQHGLRERLLDLDQAARVLRPGAGDAARSAELDARGDLVPAGGQEGGGQAVAGVAGKGLPVEGELQRGGAVDAAAGGGAEGGAHEVTGFGSSRRYTLSKR